MGGNGELEARIPARLSPAEGRKFGLLVGGAFLLLGGVSYWRGHEIAPAVLWALGGALVLAGLLIPGHLGPVYRGWMRFAVVLSRITTPIVMGVIYYGLFTPMGFIRRRLGRNAMIRPPGDSFWISREPGARRSDLSRQF
jgi:saxitoxin biosynthesis operon SxtJ-like protein